MLKLKNISFSYTKEKPVLSDISLQANKGNYVAVVGESGCGKSTLLELIYGLLSPNKGTIFWKDRKLLGPKFNLIPGEDFMKYLPQDFDLMPYISVEENVGKHISRLEPKRNERIRELLEVVDMSEFISTKVKLLSGGQKQRVAIAKVLAREPEILLLDEPFSHIDNFRKNNLRRKLFAYIKSKNILCIVATHDITDALSFANDILIIQDGSIAYKGSPEQIYNNPPNAYVASFFNEINELPESAFIRGSKSTKSHLFYPEQIKLDEQGVEAEVLSCYFKGSYYLIEAEINKELTVYFNNTNSINKGRKINLMFSHSG